MRASRALFDAAAAESWALGRLRIDDVEINLRTDGDKAVLALSGRLVRDEHLRLVREKVSALLREGYREFVVDLTAVSYVDSAGLGELVALYASVHQEGAAVLRVTGLSNRLADLSSSS